MEFNLVQQTVRAPFNKCYLCGEHEGPFMDTFFEQFGYGWVHICAPKYDEQGQQVRPGCIGNMATKCGWAHVGHLEEKLSQLMLRIAELESEENLTIRKTDLDEWLHKVSFSDKQIKKKAEIKIEEESHAA